jgi:hypothetical protein
LSKQWHLTRRIRLGRVTHGTGALDTDAMRVFSITMCVL